MGEEIKREEAIEAIRGVQRGESNTQAQTLYQDLEDQRLKAQLERQEYIEIITMRRAWSKWILIAILAVTVFDFFVVSAVGFGFMKFQNDNTLPFFIGESLLKTLGLAIIIVNFLFNKELIGRK